MLDSQGLQASQESPQARPPQQAQQQPHKSTTTKSPKGPSRRATTCKRVEMPSRLPSRLEDDHRNCSGSSHGNFQGPATYGRVMPMLRIEIAATDQIEAKRIQSVYQRGERNVKLDDEATDEAWRAGYTPVGRPVFVGLTNGEPLSYRFDVPVETSVR